jgi:hypothetical protein
VIDAPERRIVGFHMDEQSDWVAELSCGHTVHMRHDPPWQNRPWVLDEDSRARMLGATIACILCARS